MVPNCSQLAFKKILLSIHLSGPLCTPGFNGFVGLSPQRARSSLQGAPQSALLTLRAYLRGREKNHKALLSRDWK